MLAYTYMEKGVFELKEKSKPMLKEGQDAIVKVTLASICASDLHIKYGSVPKAVPGITVGHEMVGVVESIGTEITAVKPGDRVTVNVETFCGHCFFCRHGYVNNCIDSQGGWSLGCRIDGGQAEYVRVPYANQGLTVIPDNVSDEQALFVGDILATGFWSVRIADITPGDTILVFGAGPTGICTMLCALLKSFYAKKILNVYSLSKKIGQIFLPYLPSMYWNLPVGTVNMEARTVYLKQQVQMKRFSLLGNALVPTQLLPSLLFIIVLKFCRFLICMVKI